ncbi:hypothetical protein DXC51_16545 [Eisenbergiella massiliensis]|uniref:Uncharacterized protein n=1 Tax=Eisenbergiella massiliensis TaxID=1720294 RepID=A0A3E3I1W4_9FIRM|nr:hypothetical protein DXC51_16545 [Eisenbergiella massiliensis]
MAESGNILQYITFRKFYKGNFLRVSRGGPPIMRESCGAQGAMEKGGAGERGFSGSSHPGHCDEPWAKNYVRCAFHNF